MASKIYTNFKMHQSSLQPEKMILVHLLDGVPPLNAKPTLTLTPPSVTEFSPGLLHSAFSGQTAYRARKLSHQFAHSAKPDRVFRLFSHCTTVPFTALWLPYTKRGRVRTQQPVAGRHGATSFGDRFQELESYCHWDFIS